MLHHSPALLPLTCPTKREIIVKQNKILWTVAMFAMAIGASPAHAQTGMADHVECLTNSGIPGVIFQGHFATVAAPTDVAGATLDQPADLPENPSVSDSQVEVFPTVQYRDDMLVFAYPNAAADHQTTIYFTDKDGHTQGACTVSVVPLDPDEHDFAMTSKGYCRFGQDAGVSQFTTGSEQIFDLPEKYFEGGISGTSSMEYAPVFGARQIRFTARSAGHTTFLWLGEDNGSGAIKGLCPFMVSD